MKLLHQCVVFGSFLMVASCASESPWSAASDDGGKISLQLSTDVSVYTSTRANDGESPVKPDGDLFRIKLESTDGSFSKEWENLAKFNNEEGFNKGSYTITASYGDPAVQGFKNPYYVGTESVNVIPGETTSTTIKASLANSMVSVRYTDSFLNNFSKYSAFVTSSEVAGSEVVFAQNEDKPAYVAPGQITVAFKLERDGKEVTVAPATFTAVPKRHYIVTANVTETGDKGVLALDVQFAEDVVHEDVEILLSDELFNTPAPVITAKGFSAGDEISTFESVSIEQKPEFHVIAYGGFQNARFSVRTVSGTAPDFGNEVDLATADAAQQILVENSGLETYGFFRKPGAADSGVAAENQMGIVNMKKFIESLKPGEYQMSLSVTDKLGRVFESETPLTLTAKVEGIQFQAEQDPEASRFMGDEVSVLVSTNYAEAKDKFTFQAQGADGEFKDAPVKSITPVTITRSGSTRAGLEHSFRYVLSVDKISDTQLGVKVNYPNKTGQEITAKVTVPEFTVEADPFAKRVKLKITPSDPADLEWMLSKARFYWGDGKNEITNGITVDSENGIITVPGLEPSHEYSKFAISYGNSYERHNKIVSFTTEDATDVPNGDFSQENQTINLTGIQVGGEYSVLITYRHKSSIVRNEAVGWSSINNKTCYDGSSPWNTWFMVPSTFCDGGKVVVQSVGYNHHGTVPEKSSGAITYYCTNSPSDSQLEKAAGELFLGSYSFDGTEHRNDGILFASRPTGISFDYEYTPLNDETGDILIKIIDASGNIIAENSKLLKGTGSNSVNDKLALPEYSFGAKAAKIEVRFRSSTAQIPAINIPSGSALDESQGLGNKTIKANEYKAFAVGSKLVLDNVKLLYDKVE